MNRSNDILTIRITRNMVFDVAHNGTQRTSHDGDDGEGVEGPSDGLGVTAAEAALDECAECFTGRVCGGLGTLEVNVESVAGDGRVLVWYGGVGEGFVL